MTSSFSNLVLAGQALFQREAVGQAVDACGARARSLLPAIDQACRAAAAQVRDRIVMLSSSPLQAWGQEAGLKSLEMVGGRISRS